MSDGNLVIDAYLALTSTISAKTRVRSLLRDAAVFSLSIGKSIGRSGNWIRFPYYHHVFSDERRGFGRQMDYLRNFGDFISLDRAVEMLATGDAIDGRYFCITFDDGIKCCYDHALPILKEREIPAAFFIVTEYTADTDAGESRVCRPLHRNANFNFEYLTWRECKEMISAGMTIGSHTCSHSRLICLTPDEIKEQLSTSKRMIEEKLCIPCKHFACPWGGAGKDFDPRQDVEVARDIGYHSFLTTHRGANKIGCSPFAIHRDNTYANWGNYQLRYFLSL